MVCVEGGAFGLEGRVHLDGRGTLRVHVHREGIVDYDLAVLGGGRAGYAAALRDAQLGMTVACVPSEDVAQPAVTAAPEGTVPRRGTRGDMRLTTEAEADSAGPRVPAHNHRPHRAIPSGAEAVPRPSLIRASSTGRGQRSAVNRVQHR